ncbi:MAG: hypothetical protein M0Q91_13255 [Methanoregula sp.]|nr:hypothetical protein [Methanoregula sp.]
MSASTADRIVIMPNGKFRLSAVITHCPGYPARPAPSMSIPGKRADRIRDFNPPA